jgi:hypothetical protein
MIDLSSKVTLAFVLAAGAPIIGVAASAARHETRLDEIDRRGDDQDSDREKMERSMRRDRELLQQIRADGAAVKAQVETILQIVAGDRGPPKRLMMRSDDDEE